MKRSWSQIRTHPSRYGALLLAITISVGFVVTSLVFVETESGSLKAQVAAAASEADVVVAPTASLEPISGEGEGELPSAAELTGKLAAVPGVADAAAVPTMFLETGQTLVQAYPLPPESLRWARLQHGAWPQSPGEIAIDSAFAAERSVEVGDKLTVSFYGPEGEPTEAILQVSGITIGVRSLLSGVSFTGFIDPGFTATHAESTGSPLWLIRTADGADRAQMLADVRAALEPYGETLTAVTASEYATLVAQNLTGGVDMFRVILLVFGAIAMVVGLLIIANTFTILVAQRRRQIGLIRAVGASTGQVRQELLGEAALLGAIGSAFGVAIGIGLGAVGAAITGSLAAGLVVPWTVAVVFGVGVVITLLAAWLPSLRTSAIKPLEALRAAATDSTRQHPGAATTVVALLLVLAGIGALVVAVMTGENSLLLAVAAGITLSLGVLLGAGWYVPGLVRLIGALPARTGPTARLAVANAVRNPKRTTATCLALMLAVGLVVTLQVGSASVKASTERSLVENYPVPLMVSGQTYDEPLPAGTVERVRGVDGVTAAIGVRTALVEIDGQEQLLSGVGGDVSSIVPGMAIGPTDYVVLPPTAKERGWTDGDRIELTVGSAGKQTMTVRVHKIAGYGGAVVAADTLAEWATDAHVTSIWASVDSRDATAARSTMEAVQDLDPNLSISGSIAMTTILTQVLDTLLLIATGLLGAAVLIALIGVGNTLGLSVLERTRESALLRALGLQRSQLRGMLAIEATFLAVAGAVVGIIAGIGFGYLGTWALLAELGEPVLLRVSPPMLLIDAGIAVAAGLLASVLPAKRAVSAAPTEALAEV